jgi:hypothetical protein
MKQGPWTARELQSATPTKELGMSHQDRMSRIVVNHQTIKQVVDWLLVPCLFAGLKTRGGAKWKPRMLAVAALLWATSGEDNLTDRFVTARKVVHKLFRWQGAPGESYQGFMKVLHKWHLRLLLAIVPHVQTQMKQVLPGLWLIAGYVVFAGDGSRIELPRTESLEGAFSPRRKKPANKKQRTRKSNSKQTLRQRRLIRRKTAAQRKPAKRQSEESVAKKENSPQMWLTLLWHVGTGLPWDWRTGPSDSSERAHLQEILAKLPENSLLTADAGFVGYDFWKAILDAGQHFVIRVGGNVRLLKNLGYARQHEHTVYLWPDAAAKKKQPPLVLRLIVVHNGKHPVYLVTNLSKSELSDRQAGTIYAARWGIELFFRTFKQTFGRRKLRSRCAENAPLELDWSMLALWCLCLVGQRELAGGGKDPTRLSAAAAIAAFQGMLRDYRVRPECRQETLWEKLQSALLDDYERATAKTSRNYPRKKKRETIGAPEILHASKEQVTAANELKQNQLQFRLTA